MPDSRLIRNQAIYSDEQIVHLSSLHHINQIDENLRVVASIDMRQTNTGTAPRVVLALELYFYNKRIDTLSFDLNNYEYKEIIHLAKNIRSNEFLLQEIDNFLAGDIVE